MTTTRVYVAVAAFLAVGVSAARAQFLTVYGGPAYDAPRGNGFQNFTIPRQQLGVSASGIAVGSAHKFTGNLDVGARAVRWDAHGNATDLGTLGTNALGTSLASALAVNDAGTTVGWGYKYDGSTLLYDHPLRWDAGSTSATELGTLDPPGILTFAYARAINAAGTAVGNARKGTTGFHAVRWNASGTAATELGFLSADTSGRTSASATAVNDSGTIVGYAHMYSADRDLGSRAVRWDAGTTAAIELDNLGADLSGITNAYAFAANAGGTIIGSAEKFGDIVFDHEGHPYKPDLGLRPVRWDADGVAATELGNLGVDASGETLASANALNDAGTVVGVAHRYNGQIDLGSRAVRWDAGSTVAIELGNLGASQFGVTAGNAFAINNDGIAVGLAWKYVGGTPFGDRAVLWYQDGRVLDLNTLIDPASGWTLRQAFSISDTNFIAGVGSFDPDGAGPAVAYDRGFLLNVSAAVPEPISLVTLAVAAVSSLTRRYRLREKVGSETGIARQL